MGQGPNPRYCVLAEGEQAVVEADQGMGSNREQWTRAVARAVAIAVAAARVVERALWQG